MKYFSNFKLQDSQLAANCKASLKDLVDHTLISHNGGYLVGISFRNFCSGKIKFTLKNRVFFGKVFVDKDGSVFLCKGDIKQKTPHGFIKAVLQAETGNSDDAQGRNWQTIFYGINTLKKLRHKCRACIVKQDLMR